MNKRTITNMLGIFGGFLIILGVFFPFIKTSEFSISLWQTFVENKQIYLSIVIIIFGLIPIVSNIMNKKVEFSFTSVGSLSFFLIVEILGTVSDLKFSSLNLGFYFILIGTILTLITTISSSKKRKKESSTQTDLQEDNKIDDLPLDKSDEIDSDDNV